MNKVRTIVIENYPDKVVMSKSRRSVYYVNGDKRGVKKIPKKYTGKGYLFNKEGYLIDKSTKERIIANPKTSGKERLWVVNFQDIWSGNISRIALRARVNALKDVLRPYIQKVNPLRLEEYPLGMEIILYNTSFQVDASNKGVIYTKVIEDLLVNEGKIIDDGPKYMQDTGRIILKEGKPKMIINLYTINDVR